MCYIFNRKQMAVNTQPDENQVSSKQRRRVRLIVQILIFSALVSLCVTIPLYLQRVIQRGIVGVRDNLIIRLEK